MSEQHFRSFMPHLTSKPEQVNALANVPSGERVACLVRIAIAYTSFFRVGTQAFFRIASAFAQGARVFVSLNMKSLFSAV